MGVYPASLMRSQNATAQAVAISGVVPVVGGIIAEASETVLAGASVLKGTIGVFGLLGVLALCAYPFLQLGIQYLLYQLTRFLASVIGSPELCAVIKGLGGGYTGYHRFALIIAATFIFTIAVTVINLPKKQVGKKAEKVSFKDIFSIIKRNDQLRWAVALILLYNVGIQFIMGVATYYFAYVCNNSGMLSAFMISASIAEVVGLIIFPKVTKMLSRKKAFLLACILPAIGLMILLLTGIFAPQNIVLTVIAGVIVKTGTGLELGCATVFLADVVDYGEYKLGVRNEGVVFSLQTLIVKLTAAFTSLSIGFALDLTGYVPNQIQSLATQNSIRVLMCVIPAVGMLLAYVVYRRKYKLNDAYMKKVVSAISSPQTELTSEKTTEEAA